MSNDPFGIAKHLSSHGHAFHYSTLKVAHEASTNLKSGWVFEASEFPVVVNGHSTRIDYILKWHKANVHLVVECKRANPTLCKWHFLKSPYTRREASSYAELHVETIFHSSTPHEKMFLPYTEQQRQKSGSFANVKELSSSPAFPAYDLAFELRGMKKPKADDSDEVIVWESKGRGDIEEAAAQVSKGVNGLVEYYKRNPPSDTPMTQITFIPVIVTTADLFGVETDLSASDIETGNVRSDQVNVEQKPWVYLQYPVSPTFKHSYNLVDPDATRKPTTWPLDLGARLYGEYRRTIPIVQGKHFAAFLNSFGQILFGIDAPE